MKTSETGKLPPFFCGGIALEALIRAASNIYFKWGAAAILLFFTSIIFFFLIFMFVFSSFFGSFKISGGFSSGSPTDYAKSEIPPDYLRICQQAQEKYGVSWAILAAIAGIESGFGKSEYYLKRSGVSEEGAVGIMQFMPTTWSGSSNPIALNSPHNPRWDTNPASIAKHKGYGVDCDGDGNADPFDPEDAIMSAANMLKADGINENPRDALFLYNQADWYVSQVLAKAESYANMIPQGTGDWPLPNRYTEISSGFGVYRQVKDEKTGELISKGRHDGIDIPCPVGVPVYAVMDGIVKDAGWIGGYGNCIFLGHPGRTETIYGHLSKVAVRLNQQVNKGDLIGYSGNTGKSSGPHLHFEVRVNNRSTNPEDWLNIPSKNY